MYIEFINKQYMVTSRECQSKRFNLCIKGHFHSIYLEQSSNETF